MGVLILGLNAVLIHFLRGILLSVGIERWVANPIKDFAIDPVRGLEKVKLYAQGILAAKVIAVVKLPINRVLNGMPLS